MLSRRLSYMVLPVLLLISAQRQHTITLIHPGSLLGCAIAPGIGISTEALYQKAAKLPRIELVKPKSVVGRNTVAAMQAGIIFGYVGQVDGIVERVIQEFNVNPTVIATGGLAELISSESVRFRSLIHCSLCKVYK